MSSPPVIAFGQQPCGFFPRRFLYSKIMTARRLREELGGGELVYFCHDSDHDPRETKTILRHRKTGEIAELNFAIVNKTQRRFSPLHLKQIAPGWQENTARQLAAYAIDPRWIAAFKEVAAASPADFCLQMYARMGLLDGVRVVRSSDPDFRRAACDIDDYFVDVPHASETVRARLRDGVLCLHEGGACYTPLPAAAYGKEQISAARDTRLKWMQSVLRCTHYVCGASEQAYLRREDAPEIVYVNREPIDRSDEAWTGEE